MSRKVTSALRRSGSARPAAKRFRRRREQPCREPPAAGSRPGISCALPRLRPFRCAVLGERGFQRLRLFSEFVGFLALRAEQEHPEADGQDGDHEHRDDDLLVVLPLISAFRRVSLERRGASAFRRRGRGRFGALVGGRDRRRVEGDDDVELGDEVARAASSPPPSAEPPPPIRRRRFGQGPRMRRRPGSPRRCPSAP